MILSLAMVYVFSAAVRAPQALDEETYNLLYDCLLNKKRIVLSKKSSAVERRVYRYLKSEKYKLDKIQEPITKEIKEVIVSIFLLIYIFIRRMHLLECMENISLDSQIM